MTMIETKRTDIHPLRTKIAPFIQFFNEIKETPNSPMEMSYKALAEIEKNSRTQDELLGYLLEDIIFLSLYATFFEELGVTMSTHPNYAKALAVRFQQNYEEREQLILRQAQDHLNFLLRNGGCPGCMSCDNHGDVIELIPYLRKRDIDFFVTLYLGMQTIHFALESLLYDFVPANPKLLPLLLREHIIEFRQYAYAAIEKELSS